MNTPTSQPCWIAAVIQDEAGDVLLVRSSNDQARDLPAGVVGQGEDVVSAVRRVVADTAMIGVSVGWLAGIHSHAHDGVTLVFLARHASGRVEPKGHAQACCWTGVDRAQLLWPARAEQLRRALESRQPQPVTVVVGPAGSGRQRPVGRVGGGLGLAGGGSLSVSGQHGRDPR